jgi:hypothetical protein
MERATSRNWFIRAVNSDDDAAMIKRQIQVLDVLINAFMV